MVKEQSTESVPPALNGPVTTGHIGLNVQDLDRSKEFYRKVFGLTVAGESRTPGRESVFLSDGQRLVLTLWKQAAHGFDGARSGLHHLSFEVKSAQEVENAERQLREWGVPFHHHGIVTHSPEADSGGIFFEDPDGIRLEIYAPSGMANQPHVEGPACGFF